MFKLIKMYIFSGGAQTAAYKKQDLHAMACKNMNVVSHIHTLEQPSRHGAQEAIVF